MSQLSAPQRYASATRRLLTLADFERKSRADQPPDWHLKRMQRLMQMLGDPHLAKPTVHIAGSKGKGSTAAMIASALTANGYRSGLYTSPHIHRFTERIRVDSKPISEGDFADLVEDLWNNVEQIEKSGDLGVVSVFEMLTAMAFVYFRDCADTDISIIEVGLGGRLDATNAVQPEVAVITPISLDHVPILGETIPEIAAEKAGIIKSNAVTVSAAQPRDALHVIEARSDCLGAPLTNAESIVRLDQSEPPATTATGQTCSLISPLGKMDLSLGLLGEHQISNARTAVAALYALAQRGFNIRAAPTAQGISSLVWECRSEPLKIAGETWALLDGAHNDASARALMRTVERHYPKRKGIGLVLGGTAGHDAGEVAREIAVLQPDFTIATQSRHPKSIDCREIARYAERNCMPEVHSAASVAEAMEIANRIARQRGIRLIIATGSLFVAAEAREHILGIKPELYPALTSPYLKTYSQ